MIVRITLPHDRIEPVLTRACTRVSESGCDLCGIDNIREALLSDTCQADPAGVENEYGI